MHISLRVGLFVGVIAYVASLTSAQSQLPNPLNEKNPRIQLVSEFVRELEVFYRLRETATKEVAEDGNSLATSIRAGTRTVYEMNDSIYRLDRIAIDGQWADFRDLLKGLDNERIRIMQEMIQMSKAMLSGPKPGVDYGAMAAHAPELTAEAEQLDKDVFKISQGFFLALVDERRIAPDGKLYHLLLTKKERAGMIQYIDSVFGSKLEEKNPAYIVGAAWAIKYGLTRSLYKSADEP